MGSRGVYSFGFENVSVSAAQDLFYCAPADDRPVVLRAVFLANVGGTADMGDAQAESVRLAVIRGYTSVGSGGSSVSAGSVNHHDGRDADPGFTARTNDTTLANTGTVFTWGFGWNVQLEKEMWWDPPTFIRCDQGQSSVVIRLMAAPADAISMSGFAVWEEV